MDTKQRVLLVLTVVALGFLGYQIFQLVDQDITQTPVLAEQQAQQQQPVMQQPAAISTPQQPVVAQQKPVQSQGQPHTQLSQSQHTYVKMLNQYELTKMQRQLVEEQAAVADAQQKIALDKSKTKSVLEKSGISANGVMGGAPNNFVLSYVDKQSGEWSATLHKGGNYESVSVGSALPGGFQVVDIDHQGVTLQKGAQREQVTFNGVVKLAALPQPSLTMGTATTQAHLLALQLVHHGAEVKAIARSGLKIMPAEPALKQGKPIAVSLHRRQEQVPPYQLSIEDKYAQEGEDDTVSAAGNLPAELHLRSVEIQPKISQPYSIAQYLPQQMSLPQAYHLSADSSGGSDAAYSQETADTQMPAPQKLNLSEKRLLKLPKDYYTIQLIGSYHPDVVKQFVLDNELKHIALQLSLGNPQHPWAIALYGVYNSFEQAEAKLIHLSPHMRTNGAWIRKIGDIQQVFTKSHSA